VFSVCDCSYRVSMHDIQRTRDYDLIDKCNNRFDNFKKLHDIEVNRLRGCKNLSSIAI